FFHLSSTTAIYTLSLHDALPIWLQLSIPDRIYRLDGRLVSESPYNDNSSFDIIFNYDRCGKRWKRREPGPAGAQDHGILPSFDLDRKSTRLNSSHVKISYAVFCL